MTMGIKLKTLEEHYKVAKYYYLDLDNKDITYGIYDKKSMSGIKTPHKFLCSLSRKGRNVGVIQLDGTITLRNNIEDLNTDINSFVESLEFNSEFYNPQYREGYCDELCVIHHLFDNGWGYSDHSFGLVSYKLTKPDVYGGLLLNKTITFDNLDTCGCDLTKDVVIMLNNNDDSYVRVSCKREAKEIIKTIDSLLKPYLLHGSGALLDESKKYTTTDFDADMVTTRGLNSTEQKYRDELITKLEEQLKILKG